MKIDTRKYSNSKNKNIRKFSVLNNSFIIIGDIIKNQSFSNRCMLYINCHVLIEFIRFFL